MCGIFALVGPDANRYREGFTKSLQLLDHRGPNGSDVYEDDGILLGHTRLAILDLSAAGSQPMRDAIRGNVISYNGEIYNYVELKSELERIGEPFRSTGDTEVLLHALGTWGHEALPRLNGMWAFLAWDERNRRLLLSRDRFGVKPLYYARIRDMFVFASEPKAMTNLFPELRAVNTASLAGLVAESALYWDDESFYKDIKLVPKGTWALIEPSAKGLHFHTYWELPKHLGSLEHSSDNEVVAELETRLSSAVQMRLRSDVPMGISLSGGIDSTLILALANRSLNDPLVCITSTYGASGEGELAWAELAADRYGSSLYLAEASQDGWCDAMPKLSWHMDAPGYSPAIYPMWVLMREARSRGISVMLEGQGADEAFGGYAHYSSFVIEGLLSQLKSGKHLARTTAEIRALAATFSVSVLAKWLLRRRMPNTFRNYRTRVGAPSALRGEVFETWRMKRSVDHPATSLEEAMRCDHQQTILPGLLHYGDAISMAASVESRLPFMDFRLVELAFALTGRQKIAKGLTKAPLRSLLRKLNSDEVANRRDKKGYPTPVLHWLAHDKAKLASEILLTTPNRLHQYCEPRALARLVARHSQNPTSGGDAIYKLVSTKFWLDTCT
jgi:asparagine synthase (glutamine-hydrolysing)